MSQVADLYDIMDSSWCDREVLLANQCADGVDTRAMLSRARALGLEVLVEYEMAYHPQGGDYICGVTEPCAYQNHHGQRVRVADTWLSLFEWVRRNTFS